jgi:hypothetical protein
LLGYWATASPAGAYPNDVDLSGLVEHEGGCDPFASDGANCEPLKDASGAVPDQQAFDGLMEELAVILAPRDVGLAKTPGQAGFDVGAEVTLHRINNQRDYWARTLEQSTHWDRATEARPPVYPAMGTAQFWAKKGLPYSFEVGAGATWLLQSRMVAPGVMAKWTLNEGFFWFPDVALTAGANRALCVELPSTVPFNDVERASGTTPTSCGTDVALLTATLGAVVSKTFAFAGMLNVSPYAGWQKVLLHAFSPQLDRDEHTNDKTGETFRFRDYKFWSDLVGNACGEAGTDVGDCVMDRSGTTPLPQVHRWFTHRNKLYGGLNVQFAILQAQWQVEMTHIRGTGWKVESPAVNTAKLALVGVSTPDVHFASTLRLGFRF